MKVALLNSFMLNGGDAGIVYGTLDAISEVVPNADVTVFAVRAAAASRYYPELRLRPMLFDAWPAQRRRRAAMRSTFRLRSRHGLMTSAEKQFFEALSEMDAIVYCGGGYINEHYNTQIVLDVMERTLALRIPHMAYGHSVGPLIRERTRRRVGRLLNQFAAVTTRDQASQDLLMQLGVQPERTRLLADAAFSMRLCDTATIPHRDRETLKEVEGFKRAGGNTPLILVSVREWKFPHQPNSSELRDRLPLELTRLLSRLLGETDRRICFLSTCQGRPEYGYDDSAVAAALVTNLKVGQDRVLVCKEGLSPRTYPYLIRECADLVISMRMHFVVFSILAGVPFVSLAYERKSIELCRQLGLAEYCHDVSNMEADAVMMSIMSALANRDALRRTIGNVLRDVKARSVENAVTLAGLIRKTS